MLDVVDLDAVQQAVYETLVDRVSVTFTDLQAALGVEPGSLQRTLEKMESRGLVNRVPGTPVRYAAIPPEIAVEVLLLETEERIKHARRYAAELTRRFHQTANRRDPADLVEIITGRQAVQQRVEQLHRTARTQLRGLDRPPYMTPLPRTDVEMQHHVGTELLRRGVRYRAVYDPTGLNIPGRLHNLEFAIRLGESAKVLPHIPIKLLLADDHIGLVPLTTEPASTDSCMVVHPSALLEALAALFESLWDRALPLALPLSDVPPIDSDTPTANEARLVALLTTGMPDEAIARHMGLSHRTLRRRIHRLMRKLDAETRFQAGLHAALMGWVSKSHDIDTPEGPPL